VDLLETMSIEREIRVAYTRFCDLIDSKNFGRLDEVFLPDCKREYRTPAGELDVRDVDEHGEPNRGLASLIRRLSETLGADVTTQHNFTNLAVEIRADGTVSAVCHFNALHKQRDGADIFSIWGRYADEFTLSKDGWRIYSRLYSVLLTEGNDFVLGDRKLRATS
jgi:3-phenylpropionate/cinnamic acid dioxygenase small subunit